MTCQEAFNTPFSITCVLNELQNQLGIKCISMLKIRLDVIVLIPQSKKKWFCCSKFILAVRH